MVKPIINANIKSGFKGRVDSASLKYKQELAKGIQESFQFTPKIENFTSILSPEELKSFLKLFKTKPFNDSH